MSSKEKIFEDLEIGGFQFVENVTTFNFTCSIVF